MSRLELDLESIRDRNKVLNDEMCSTNDDRVKLTEKVDELKQQLYKLQQEKDSTLRTAMKQVSEKLNLFDNGITCIWVNSIRKSDVIVRTLFH